MRGRAVQCYSSIEGFVALNTILSQCLSGSSRSNPLSDFSKPLFSQVITELPGAPVEDLPRPAPRVTISPRPPGRKQTYLWVGCVVAAVIGIGIWAVIEKQRTSALASSAGGLRTAVVERRDFVRVLRLTGTVQAIQSYTIAAPRLAGQQIGQLTVTKLTPSGTKVKQGDLLVEFDRQDQIKNSLDRKAEYLGLIEVIQRKRADQSTALARDETGLKTAEDALETAKLEVRKNEVISRIDAEKNQQNLEQAEAILKQLRETFDLKRRAAEADLKTLEIQRDRSRATMLYADSNAERMAIHSPLDGLAVLNSIWMNGQMREVQEGDQVRPGVPFMQVVNPDTMEVRARANQADVPLLRPGQPVQMRLDAYPEMVLTGTLDRIAAIGQTSELSDKVHYFGVELSVHGSDPRLMPDLSAAVDVELERRPNSLVLPLDAVIAEKDQSYVRVKNGLGFEKRAVKVGPTSDVDVVVESGVEVGAVVLRGAV
jgi:HlyD family secretion protein